VGLFGILLGLGLLMFLAFRGWSILVLAPAAGLIAAAFAGEPLLAHWTQTFMLSAARFIAQFFPLFLLGALFGKLMDDSGSVGAIAKFMTEKLGPSRAILSVVLAGAMVTYGGVSLFVAFFMLVPMGQALFRAAPFHAASCRPRWRSAPPPSPCPPCPARPPSRTPSRCRSSAPRPSRPPASA
jgi:H+/gluconate symporter-like permease